MLFVGEPPGKPFCLPLWCEYSKFHVTLLLRRSDFSFWILVNSALLKSLSILWPISLVCLMWKQVGTVVRRKSYSSDEPQKKTRGLPWLVNNGCCFLHYADVWIFTLKTSKSCWMWACFKLNPECFFVVHHREKQLATGWAASRAFKNGIVPSLQAKSFCFELIFFSSLSRWKNTPLFKFRQNSIFYAELVCLSSSAYLLLQCGWVWN